MKKGLRLVAARSGCGARPLKPCPDEEGIKTLELPGLAIAAPLKPCPDEEGIKTRSGSAILKKQADHAIHDEVGFWGWEDFEPIAKAIDQLFRQKG